MNKILNLIEEAQKLTAWEPAQSLLNLNGVKIRLGRYTPNMEVMDEMHDVDEFLTVLSGKIEVNLNNTIHHMSKNDYVIVPAGSTHSVKVSEEAVMLVIRFMP